MSISDHQVHLMVKTAVEGVSNAHQLALEHVIETYQKETSSQVDRQSVIHMLIMLRDVMHRSTDVWMP